MNPKPLSESYPLCAAAGLTLSYVYGGPTASLDEVEKLLRDGFAVEAVQQGNGGWYASTYGAMKKTHSARLVCIQQIVPTQTAADLIKKREIPPVPEPDRNVLAHHWFEALLKWAKEVREILQEDRKNGG